MGPRAQEARLGLLSTPASYSTNFRIQDDYSDKSLVLVQSSKPEFSRVELGRISQAVGMSDDRKARLEQAILEACASS